MPTTKKLQWWLDKGRQSNAEALAGHLAKIF